MRVYTDIGCTKSQNVKSQYLIDFMGYNPVNVWIESLADDIIGVHFERSSGTDIIQVKESSISKKVLSYIRELAKDYY